MAVPGFACPTDQPLAGSPHSGTLRLERAISQPGQKVTSSEKSPPEDEFTS